MKEEIIKNAFVTAIALAFFGLTTFAYNVLIGRIYGAETLGLANTAISTFFFVGIFVAFFSRACNKITAEYLGREENENANYLLTFSFIFTAVLGLAIFFLLLLLKNRFITTFNLVDTIFFQLVFLILLRGLFDVFRSAYYGTHRVNQYLKVIVTSSIIFIVILIPFYFILLPLLLPFIIMYSVFIAVSAYLFKGNFSFKLPKELKRRVQKYTFSFSSIAIIGTLSAMGTNNLGVMLSAMYLNPTQVGYFSAANSFLQVLNYIPAILPYALFPVISYEFGRNNIDGIKKALNRIMRVWTMTLGIIIGLGIIYSQIFLELFFGSEYLPAVLPLNILIIGFFWSALKIPLISTLSGTKYVHISTFIGILGFAVTTTAFMFLIPKFYIIGTAFSILIGSFITIVIPFYYAKKLFYFEFKNFFIPFIKFSIIFVIIMSLFTKNLIWLYFIGGPLFISLYALLNKEEVIYIWDGLKVILQR